MTSSTNGVAFRVRRGKRAAWLVAGNGKKVAPPTIVAFRVPLTKRLRLLTELTASPQYPTLSADGHRLLFCNGRYVPLAELDRSITKLRVA